MATLPFLLIADVGRWLLSEGLVTEAQIRDAGPATVPMDNGGFSVRPLTHRLVEEGVLAPTVVPMMLERIQDRLLHVGIDSVQFGRAHAAEPEVPRQLLGHWLLMADLQDVTMLQLQRVDESWTLRLYQHAECCEQEESRAGEFRAAFEGLDSVLRQNGSPRIPLDIDGRRVDLTVEILERGPAWRRADCRFDRSPV